MATTVEVIPVRNTAELFRQYPRELHPQPCYLELDTRTGMLRADWNPEIGMAVPMNVFCGMVRRYRIPCLQAEVANQLLATVQGLAQIVVDGTTIEWDGHNHVARLNDDAQTAEQEIYRTIEDAEYGDADCVQVADPADWLYDSRDELARRVQAGERITDLVQELDGDGNDDNPILLGLGDYLENLRNYYPEEGTNA